MPSFGDDGIYVWSITLLGIATPTLLCTYALLRAVWAKRRLKKFEEADV